MKKTKIVLISIICALVVFLCILIIIRNVGVSNVIGKGVPDETVFQITERDADALMDERLEDTGFDHRRLSLESVSGNSVYVYDILSGEQSTGEKLAVNAVSGDVYVYSDGTLKPYSDFSAYNAGLDETIEWTGTYKKDDVTLVLEETEPGSFMFTFVKEDGSESEPGFGFYEDRVKGRADYGDIQLNFDMEGESLNVSSDGTFEFSGVYRLER